MKNTILSLAMLLVFGNILTAQHQTLFSKDHDIAGFGSLNIEFSGLAGDFAAWGGAGGAIIFDDFFIGGFGLGTTMEDFTGNEESPAGVDLTVGYGGLWLGYTPNRNKLVHLYTDLKLGWGAALFKSDVNGEEDEEGDEIFILNPQVGLEFNIANFFCITTSAGYRYAAGIEDMPGLENKDLRSITGAITFRFGGFAKGNKED